MESFCVRRAVERLREGLFDPVAVKRLTVEEDKIKNVFSQGIKALERGTSGHLCICGSYGQGKSHTIAYLNQFALSQGYATSVVQLDLREAPFYRFSAVYRSIMERLCLPDGKRFTQAWKSWAEKNSLEILDSMPHRFKMVLKAMLCKNKRLSSKESSQKKHQAYRPKEYGDWLEQAWIGHDIPIASLKSAFKYREVEGYREHSLICRENSEYVQLVRSLGKLLHQMGYKGLLLFFDEAESITQGRLRHRAKSYAILDQLFRSNGFVYSVFAFTDDFFHQVNHELYDENGEIFPKNYGEAWRDLTVLRLQDFSSHGWESLLDRLIELYSQAYRVDLSTEVKKGLHSFLGKLEIQETRFKLKALVNRLDVATQQALLNP